MDAADGADRAALPDCRPARPPALSAGKHAAHPMSAMSGSHTNFCTARKTACWATVAIPGAKSRPELQDSKAAFLIAKKRGKVKAIRNARERQQHERWERCKASMRAKVEHPFPVVKRQFGYTNVRYSGLDKNGAQVLTLFALSNLWMTRRQFLPAMA